MSSTWKSNSYYADYNKECLIDGTDGADIFHVEGNFKHQLISFFSGRAEDDAFFGGASHSSAVKDAGCVLMSGADGSDTVTYADAADAVTVDLGKGRGAWGASEHFYAGIENATGSAKADKLLGDDGANMLMGGDGADLLVGRGGADLLMGGSGFDTASYAGSGAGVTVDLATGRGMKGEAEGDRLNGIEKLIGSKFDDGLVGGDAADTLFGGHGRDVIIGAGGADILVGGKCADTLTGGSGADTFVFESLLVSGSQSKTADRIRDFEAGDRIDLSRIDARSDLADDQSFDFIGGDAFTGLGQVRAWSDGTDTFVALNAQGSTAADMMIKLDGIHALNADSFLL